MGNTPIVSYRYPIRCIRLWVHKYYKGGFIVVRGKFYEGRYEVRVHYPDLIVDAAPSKNINYIEFNTTQDVDNYIQTLQVPLV